MAGSKQSVRVTILAETRKFKKAMRDVGNTSGLSKLGNGVKALGSKLAQLGKAAGLAAGAFAGFAVKAASDLEQAEGTVNDIFKQSASQVHTFAASAAKDVGLSKTSYYELANVLSTQLKNGGTGLDQLAGKTNDLIKIGADLSAGFGGSTKEAVEAISSALKGERDPIERYGVSLKQASIDAEAARLGFTKVGGSFSNEAQQAATLSLIMQQTSDMHGKFGREGDTLAHKMEVLKAHFENASATLGSYLLPVVSAVVGWLADHLGPALEAVKGWIDTYVVPAVKAAADEFKQNWLPRIQELSGWIQANLFPRLSQLAGFITSSVIPAIKNVATWIKDNKNWIVILAGAITGGLLAWKAYVTYKAIVVAAMTAIRIAQTLLNGAMKANPVMIVVTVLGALVGALITAYTTNEDFRNKVNEIWGAIKGFIKGAIDAVKNKIDELRQIPGKVKDWFGQVKDGIVDKWNAAIDWIKGVPGRIVDGLGDLRNLLKDAGIKIISGLWNGLKEKFEAVKDWVMGIGDWIADHKGPKAYDLALLVPNGGWIMQGLGQGLEQGFKPVKNLVAGMGNDLSHAFGTPTLNATPQATATAGNGAPTIIVNASMLQPTPEAGRIIARAIADYQRAGGRS